MKSGDLDERSFFVIKALNYMCDGYNWIKERINYIFLTFVILEEDIFISINLVKTSD